MNKNISNLKRWWKTAIPSKTILTFQFLFSIISEISLILSSIPTSKAISFLTISNYEKAIYYFSFSFCLIIVHYISSAIHYRLDTVQLSKIYLNVHKRLFDKIFTAQNSNFEKTSKEKIINIINNNTFELSEFCNKLTFKFSFLVKAIITLVIIFTINYLIGFTILITSILTFIIVNFLNKIIGKKRLKIQEEKDFVSELYGNIMDNRNLSNDLNLKSKLKNNYFEKIKVLIKSCKKKKLLLSIRDNWISIFYNTIVLLLTFYLCRLVKLNSITLTTFLIIIPYLTSSITKFIEFFDVSSDLQNANISSMRINTILDMNEKDLLDFGNNTIDKINGTITFTNVSYKNLENPSLQTFNALIEKNSLNLFQGERNCGKRHIFNLLTREIRPSTGTITLDSINIYDFEKNTFKSNVSYTSSKPLFFNNTIYENLKIVNPHKMEIFNACKKTKIHEIIQSLPHGYNTNIIKEPNSLNHFELFLLGLSRSLLTNSEIILIYELPIGLTKEELIIIKNILISLKGTKTLILFSATNPFNSIFDNHFLVENGKIYKQEKNENL